MADDLNINIGADATSVKKGTKEASIAISGVSKEAKELEASFRRIKSSIDPTFAATEKYNKTVAESKRLLQAELITRKEYNAAIRLGKAALDAQLQSLQQNSTASKKITAEVSATRKRDAAEALRLAQADVTAQRLATQEKINNARRERAEKAKLELQERQAIALAARLARQAATEAVRSTRAPSARSIGAVPGGSIDSGRSIKQLEYDSTRASAAASAAAQKAIAAAAQAAQAGTAAVAQAAQAAAEKASAAAANAAERVMALARAKASAEDLAIDEVTANDKAARTAQKTAAKDAADAAVNAAKLKKKADREAAEAAREAANATLEQAAAERRASAALLEFRASLSPAIAAEQRYNETMARATSLLMQNKLQTGEWTAIQKQAATQMQINTRQMGRLNQGGIQLGYQMQDVTASIASGISPMVIFAQQSGQVAYAMQGMGGAAGKLAGVLGSVYFQLAVLAVMLAVDYFSATKKAKDETVDLTDAESVRTGTLKKLTEAVDAYAKSQREANLSTEQKLALEAQGAANAGARLEAERDAKNTEIARLQATNKSFMDSGSEDVGFALILNERRIAKLKAEVIDLNKEIGKTISARASNAFTRLDNQAQSAADPTKKITTDYENARGLRATAYNAEFARIKSLADATQRDTQLRALNTRTIQQNTAAIVARDAALAAARSDKRSVGRETADFIMPIAGPITGKYGEMRAARPGVAAHQHQGMDIATPVGTAVRAAADGIVEFAHVLGNYGNLIKVNHGAGTQTRYGHLSRMTVADHQQVKQGDIIGYSGGRRGAPGAGDSTGPHLHYEVRVNGKSQDPRKGLFPHDVVALAQKELHDIEVAAEKAARASAKAFEVSEDKIRDDDTKTYTQKLESIRVIEDKRIAALRSAYGADSVQVEEAEQHKLNIVRQYEDKILAEKVKAIKQASAEAQRAENIRDTGVGIGRGVETDNVDNNAQSGLFTERQILAQRRVIMDEEYQDKVKHEAAMLDAHLTELQAERAADGTTIDRKNEIDQEMLNLRADHLGSMLNLEQDYNRKVLKSNQDLANITSQRWAGVVSTFTQSLSNAFQGFWTHSLTIGQALINMADQLVYKFADMGIQVVQRAILNMLHIGTAKRAIAAADTAAHVAATTTQTAVTVAGQAVQTGATVAGAAVRTTAAVTSDAITTGSSAKSSILQIAHAAAVAAAHVYKSIAAIPVIGPFLAPAAAAAALFAVYSFGKSIASAKGGWGEVPADGMQTELHKQEMVLPASLAVPLRQALRAPSSMSMFGGAATAGNGARNTTNNNGGSYNFHYNPSNHNMGAGFDELLRRDGQAMRKWIKNEVRNGGFGG